MHLLDLGHRKIAFIGDISDDCPEIQARYAGYRKAHEELGLDPVPMLQMTARASQPRLDGIQAGCPRWDQMFGVWPRCSRVGRNRQAH